LQREQQVQAENRERLLRMLEDKQKFEQLIHGTRREEFERKKAEFEAKLTAAREAKLAERKEKRKADRRAAYFKEIEDKKKREEDERRAKEDDERRRKQDEQAEKQRQREREIEEKLARQTRDQPEKSQPAESAAPSNVYRPKAFGGTGLAAPKSNNPEKNVDNESPWRRNNNDNESSGKDRDDKFNYTRTRPIGDGGGRDNRGEVKQDAWRRGDGEQRRIGDDNDRGGSRGGYGGPGSNNRGSGGPSSGGSTMDRNNDRGGYGNRSDRGGPSGGNRGGPGGSRFGERSDGSKADTADSWRRPNNE
jgi:translation initiation factor 3 subunit A